MKQKIKISDKNGTPMCAYDDIKTMIFNGLSNRQIIDILRQDYAFDQNEISKSIKEMRLILKGYKLGFLGSENKFKSKTKKEPIKVIEEISTSSSLENNHVEKETLTAAQLSL